MLLRGGYKLAKSKNKETIEQNYNENSIEVLEGLDAVRKRPGMYIGGKGIEALHHMVTEVVDNSVDESLGGHANEINLAIEKDGSVSVSDNGRGIPVGMNEKMKKSSLEIVFTVLHSGGKFGGNGYKISGGLHGVGLSVVNALSTEVKIAVEREGFLWELLLKNQVAPKPIKKVKKSTNTGTTINFKPDPTIFDTVTFEYDRLARKLKETAFLVKNLKLTLEDKRKEEVRSETFQYSGGIVDFVTEINTDKTPEHKKVLYFSDNKDGVEMECAIQYTEDFAENTYSYVNNIRTIEGGTHEQGFKTALTRAANDIARKRKILKDKDKNLSGDDVRDGITCILSLRMPDPSFEGQTKSKLSNSEIRGVADSIAYDHLSKLFNSNPTILANIVKRAQETAKIKETIKKSKEVSKSKSTIEIAGLSGKFAKCTTNNPDEAEIYLVEGDSAGGSAKSGRDRFFQAILPLRGKVINCEKQKLSKVLSNEEIRTMINAIGTGIGKEFDIESTKYKKIVIMTDADVDGEHIRTLLLTFFYKFMRPLIEAGYVYIAQPPLYKISYGTKDDEDIYVYSDTEKEEVMNTFKGKKFSIQRYKGLGEMNADQLWDTTMNPQTRSLIKLGVRDVLEANEVFSILMGDKVEPRRLFIEEHANEARID